MLENPITWQGVDWNMWPRDPWDVTNSPDGYIIATTSVDGLWAGDIQQEAAKIPRAVGDRAFDTSMAGQTITIQGYVRGKSLATLRVGQARMWQAWWEGAVTSNLVFQLSGYVQSYMKVRTYQRLDMPEVFPQSNAEPPLRRTFTLALRADDPTVYKVSDNTKLFAWQD